MQVDVQTDAQADVRAGTDAVMYNPFEPGFAEDPYPQYAAIRADGRVHHNPLGLRVLSHYDDCFELLRLGGTSVDERNATNIVVPPLPEDLAERQGERSRSILSLDPPDHTRLRRLVSSAFTIRRVERLRERVHALVAELLDEIAAGTGPGESVDLIARFAFPLPFVVISELLGMPDGDRDQLRAWSHEMTRSLEPFADDAELRRIVAAADQMFAHIDDVIEWKRRNPADDLLSGMIAAEEDGDRLSPVELRDQVALLYLAGHETTVNLIGNGTCALLRHRRHRDRGRADRRRRAGPHAARVVQPRRGQVGPHRRRPRRRPRGRGRPPVVRQRHPPLPRLCARATRGRGGRARARAPVPAPGAGRGRPGLERPDRAAGPGQPSGDAGLAARFRPAGSG